MLVVPAARLVVLIAFMWAVGNDFSLREWKKWQNFLYRSSRTTGIFSSALVILLEVSLAYSRNSCLDPIRVPEALTVVAADLSPASSFHLLVLAVTCSLLTCPSHISTHILSSLYLPFGFPGCSVFLPNLPVFLVFSLCSSLPISLPAVLSSVLSPT